MPTLNDLYYTFIGNKYLKPEFSTQYNVGLTWDKHWIRGVFRKLNVTLDAYYNQVENKIIATPASNQFQWTMVNLGLVGIRGVDAAVGTSLVLGPASADLRATYTFQKAQDFTDPQSPWYGLVRRTDSLSPLAQRLVRGGHRLWPLASELQFHIHGRTL